MLVAEFGVTQPPLVFAHDTEDDRLTAFSDWLHARRGTHGFLYFYIKPGGCSMFDQIIPLTQRVGWQYGYDLLGTDEDEIDMATGAET